MSVLFDLIVLGICYILFPQPKKSKQHEDFILFDSLGEHDAYEKNQINYEDIPEPTQRDCVDSWDH